MDAAVVSISPQKNGTKSENVTTSDNDTSITIDLSDTPEKPIAKKNDETPTKKDHKTTTDGSSDNEGGMKLRRSHRNRSRSTTPDMLKSKGKDDGQNQSKKTDLKTKENVHESNVEHSTNRTPTKRNAKKNDEGDTDVDDDGKDGNKKKNEKKSKKNTKKNVDDKSSSSSKIQINLDVIAEEESTAAVAEVINIAETNGEAAAVAENGKFDTDSVEMEPLIIIGEEAEPELQFDDSSDLDSGKDSPVIQRCKTRRSYTRNTTTPKSPLITNENNSDVIIIDSVVDGENSNTPEILPTETNNESIDNLSTKVQVGSDATILNYTETTDTNHSTPVEDLSYLNPIRERSLHDTLRGLSPRRPIRPLNDSYRLRAIRNNQQLDEPDAVGSKRKRPSSPTETKRYKMSSSNDNVSSISSYLPSPFSRIKGRFSSGISVRSSTPELTAYKDEHKDIHQNDVALADPEKRNWCSVM